MLLAKPWDDLFVQSWFTLGGRPRRISGAATQAVAAIGIGALSVVGLTGCANASSAGGQSEADSAQSSVVALPTLSSAQLLREEVANAEAAILARTSELAQLATECETCQAALASAQASAAIRLEESGGTWSAWGTGAARSTGDGSLQLQPETADAPYQVGPLTAYMLATAKQELLNASTNSQLTGPQREALASILFGRQVAARLLAASFGVNPEEQLEALPESAAAALADSYPAVSDAPSSSQSDGDTSDAFLSDGSSALVQYDCARTAFMSMSDAQLSGADPSGLGGTMNDRAKSLVSLGVPDTRSLRCAAGEQSVDELLAANVQADLVLLGADDASIRAAGARFLQDDARIWVSLSPATAPTTSVLPIEGIDLEQQS